MGSLVIGAMGRMGQAALAQIREWEKCVVSLSLRQETAKHWPRVI